MRFHKLLFPALLLVIVASIGFWLYRYLQQPSVVLVLQQTAAEINTKCPMPLDDVTRLDSVKVLKHPIRSFQFNCTLLTPIKDTVERQHARTYFEPRLREKACSDPTMAYLRNHSVVVAYRYFDCNANFLFECLFGPSDYLSDEGK